jgi:drug/metabolite transporter (DMT)-like permease
MALSAFFFSIMTLTVKMAGRRLPTIELVFARAGVVALLAFADIRRRRVLLRNPEAGLLLLRGLIGLAALACLYYSVVHLPLAEATVIHFTNPVFTALIAALFLRESLHARELVLVLVAFAGVLLVARPAGLLAGTSTTLDPLAVVSALGGALFAAAAYVLVRRLRRHDAMVVVFYFAAVSVVVGLPLMLPSFLWPRGWEWLLLAGVGLSTFLGQVFLTLGLQRERAGRATAMAYLQIVFASVWGLAFFAEVPRATTVAGAAVIVGATLLLASVRAQDERPEPVSPLDTGDLPGP